MTPTPTTSHTRSAVPARRRASDVLRGLAATLALLAGVVGLPILLTTVAPLSVPSQVPTWEQLSAALLRPDGGAGLITVLALAAWAGWAVFTACVLLEITAQARGLPTPRLPLLRGTQRLTAGIVTAAALLLASNTTPAAAAPNTLVSQPALRPDPLSAADVASATPTPPSSEDSAATGAPAEAAPPATPARALPVLVVQRGDSLWRLAERHLGDGERFNEIVDLNLGRPQADGRTLTDAHWLTPGWHLLMPPDATGIDPAPAATHTTAPAASTARVHEVQPGESLWEIAEDELGDPTRYPEIYDLNAGHPQDDGRTLTDPDLIHPGWDLTLPTPPPTTSPTTAEVVPITTPPATNGGGKDTDGPLVGAPDDAGASAEDEPAPAAAAAAPTSAPAPASASASGERTVGDVEPASLSHPLVAGVTALAGAAIVALLDRRRRRQQNRRRPGERIPMPAPAEARTERELRRAAPTLTLEDVNRALHGLAPAAHAVGRDLPTVAAVRVLPDYLELLLTRDEADAIAPFTATSHRTWTATRATLLGHDEPDRGAFADPYPALVSIGADDDGAVVLLNLEAAGTLAITGTPETTTAVLRAMACELATSQPAYSALTIVGPELDDLVTATGRLAPATADARPADPAVEAARNRVALEGFGHVDALHARAERDPGEGWNPVIYLDPRPAGSVVPPWLAVVAVTTGDPVPDGAWTFAVAPNGAAHLEPVGLDLHASRLDDDAYRHVVDLLTTSTVPEEARREAAASLPVETVDTLAALPTPTAEPAEAEAAYGPGGELQAPRVLLLGPVQVDGAARRGDERTRRNTELIAYLALHPGATAAELDEIIGRCQRVTAATRNTVISRARAWLGRTPDGDPYLQPYQAGTGYRLHPDVRTDWNDFLGHARRGLTAGPAGASDLSVALELVRGRPFTGATPGTYDWADAITQEMISTIADVAHVLARTHLTAGDHESAAAAAAAGLAADPCSETLYRDAITAAGKRGDTGEVRRLATKLEAQLKDIDEGAGLDPETSSLVRRFTPARGNSSPTLAELK